MEKFSNNVDDALNNAVSNVACEGSEPTKEELLLIREQLLDLSKRKEGSFLYTLVRKIGFGGKRSGK